jgi:hypothetical protein
MEMHFIRQAEDGVPAVESVLVEEGAESLGIAPQRAQVAAATGTEPARERT